MRKHTLRIHDSVLFDGPVYLPVEQYRYLIQLCLSSFKLGCDLCRTVGPGCKPGHNQDDDPEKRHRCELFEYHDSQQASTYLLEQPVPFQEGIGYAKLSYVRQNKATQCRERKGQDLKRISDK